jgi:hypothetical protein
MTTHPGRKIKETGKYDIGEVKQPESRPGERQLNK